MKKKNEIFFFLKIFTNPRCFFPQNEWVMFPLIFLGGKLKNLFPEEEKL